MLSIVVYGRNDSYGYNLHKRAALGLNCMAEVLSHDDDEILFVDYNTPDDYPTFPEAIADTLTPRAAARLRVLRVRPTVHDRLKARTHLKAIEPIARNVAVRRSNPRNRWILSTNTDMIFVPRSRAPLSDIAAGLPAGFYHLPRFELPESLWEGFDRTDPAGVIERIRGLGRTMFLNEIVYGEDFIKYDGPGDFQLIAREDLFRIQGFNEAMVLGWHVDSNIAKRLHLLHGSVGDVVDRLFGYHCDHTRQVTPAHQHRAASNDPRTFVREVSEAPLPDQADTWGCAGEDIEEVRLAGSAHHVYAAGLATVLTGEWPEPSTARYSPDSYDAVTYDARHVLPFLADLFVSAPRQWTVAWIGGRSDTFDLFRRIWEQFAFTGPILIEPWSSARLAGSSVVRISRPEAIDGAADVLIFDFGAPSDGAASEGAGHPDTTRIDMEADVIVRRSFADRVAAERRRLAQGAVPRRFVCVNAIHNAYETLVVQDIGAAATPFASRLRHGFVKPRSEHFDPVHVWGGGDADSPPPNLLASMQVGEGGRPVDGGVLAPFGRRGVVVVGPHVLLPYGDYRVDVSIRAHSLWSLAARWRPIIVDVAAGAERLARTRAMFFRHATVTVPFSVSDAMARDQAIYFRVFRGRFVDFVITAIRLTRIDGAEGAPDDHPLLDAPGPTVTGAEALP